MVILTNNATQNGKGMVAIVKLRPEYGGTYTYAHIDSARLMGRFFAETTSIESVMQVLTGIDFERDLPSIESQLALANEKLEGEQIS